MSSIFASLFENYSFLLLLLLNLRFPGFVSPLIKLIHPLLEFFPFDHFPSLFRCLHFVVLQTFSRLEKLKFRHRTPKRVFSSFFRTLLPQRSFFNVLLLGMVLLFSESKFQGKDLRLCKLQFLYKKVWLFYLFQGLLFKWIVYQIQHQQFSETLLYHLLHSRIASLLFLPLSSNLSQEEGILSSQNTILSHLIEMLFLSIESCWSLWLFAVYISMN